MYTWKCRANLCRLQLTDGLIFVFWKASAIEKHWMETKRNKNGSFKQWHTSDWQNANTYNSSNTFLCHKIETKDALLTSDSKAKEKKNSKKSIKIQPDRLNALLRLMDALSYHSQTFFFLFFFACENVLIFAYSKRKHGQYEKNEFRMIANDTLLKTRPITVPLKWTKNENTIHS